MFPKFVVAWNYVGNNHLSIDKKWSNFFILRQSIISKLLVRVRTLNFYSASTSYWMLSSTEFSGISGLVIYINPYFFICLLLLPSLGVLLSLDTITIPEAPILPATPGRYNTGLLVLLRLPFKSFTTTFLNWASKLETIDKNCISSFSLIACHNNIPTHTNISYHCEYNHQRCICYLLYLNLSSSFNLIYFHNILLSTSSFCKNIYCDSNEATIITLTVILFTIQTTFTLPYILP